MSEPPSRFVVTARSALAARCSVSYVPPMTALFGSRVDHRKRIGIENRRIGKQARSSGIIPLICLGHKPPCASRDEHEVRPDFSFPACTVRAIPFPVDFLRKVSRETKDMLTSSIPILSYPVFALRFAREPKEALVCDERTQ